MHGIPFLPRPTTLFALLTMATIVGWVYTATAALPGEPFQDLQDQIDNIQLTPGPPGPPGPPGDQTGGVAKSDPATIIVTDTDGSVTLISQSVQAPYATGFHFVSIDAEVRAPERVFYICTLKRSDFAPDTSGNEPQRKGGFAPGVATGPFIHSNVSLSGAWSGTMAAVTYHLECGVDILQPDLQPGSLEFANLQMNIIVVPGDFTPAP